MVLREQDSRAAQQASGRTTGSRGSTRARSPAITLSVSSGKYVFLVAQKARRAGSTVVLSRMLAVCSYKHEPPSELTISACLGWPRSSSSSITTTAVRIASTVERGRLARSRRGRLLGVEDVPQAHGKHVASSAARSPILH